MVSVVRGVFLGHTHSFFTNVSLPSFLGDTQTVQTQIGRPRTRRLIRVSAVCLHNVLLKFEYSYPQIGLQSFGKRYAVHNDVAYTMIKL